MYKCLNSKTIRNYEKSSDTCSHNYHVVLEFVGFVFAEDIMFQNIFNDDKIAQWKFL